jgi:hypothetical protein
MFDIDRFDEMWSQKYDKLERFIKLDLDKPLCQIEFSDFSDEELTEFICIEMLLGDYEYILPFLYEKKFTKMIGSAFFDIIPYLKLSEHNSLARFLFDNGFEFTVKNKLGENTYIHDILISKLRYAYLKKFSYDDVALKAMIEEEASYIKNVYAQTKAYSQILLDYIESEEYVINQLNVVKGDGFLIDEKIISTIIGRNKVNNISNGANFTVNQLVVILGDINYINAIKNNQSINDTDILGNNLLTYVNYKGNYKQVINCLESKGLQLNVVNIFKTNIVDTIISNHILFSRKELFEIIDYFIMKGVNLSNRLNCEISIFHMTISTSLLIEYYLESEDKEKVVEEVISELNQKLDFDEITNETIIKSINRLFESKICFNKYDCEGILVELLVTYPQYRECFTCLYNGEPLFAYMIKCGKFNLISVLIDLGYINQNLIDDNGEDIVHYLIRYSLKDQLFYFSEKNGFRKTLDYHGNTLLHKVTYSDSIEIIDYIFSLFDDFELKNNFDESILEYCIKNENLYVFYKMFDKYSDKKRGFVIEEVKEYFLKYNSSRKFVDDVVRKMEAYDLKYIDKKKSKKKIEILLTDIIAKIAMNFIEKDNMSSIELGGGRTVTIKTGDIYIEKSKIKKPQIIVNSFNNYSDSEKRLLNKDELILLDKFINELMENDAIKSDSKVQLYNLLNNIKIAHGNDNKQKIDKSEQNWRYLLSENDSLKRTLLTLSSEIITVGTFLYNMLFT